MIEIIKNKVIGSGALKTINTSLDIKYGSDYEGITEQDETTKLIASMLTNTNEVAVGALMDDYEVLTCGSSGMTITITLGDIIVSDVTNISTDQNNEKSVLMVMAIDDVTGDPSIYAFEKTTGEYGTLPAGKSEATKIKEYVVDAGGSVLLEIANYM